jgi:UDP-N-acetyl-2-amino-2-deoxyglucuronate dehydrogenase
VAALRVAAVGAGGGAAAHFEAARLTEAFELVGVLDVDAERARAQADRYGIPRCYADVDELLADDGVGCVAVLTPPDTHESLTCAALAAGRHVVCEKPLGRTVAECDRMLAAADGAGRRLLPVHNRLYSHAIARVREIVAAGELGTPFLGQSIGVETPATVDAAAWLRTGISLGGVVIAQATHPLYVLRSLLGDVTHVTASSGAPTLDMTGEDTAAITVTFADGALASLIATFAAAPGSGDHAIGLYGTNGSVETTLRGGTNERPERLRGVLPSVFGDDALHELDLPPSEGWITSFQRMWEDYAVAIQTDAPALVSGDDGREVVRIVRAAYESMEEGRTVSVRPFESS